MANLLLHYPLPYAETKKILDYCVALLQQGDLTDNEQVHCMETFLVSAINWYGTSKKIFTDLDLELMLAHIGYQQRFSEQNLQEILDTFSQQLQERFKDRRFSNPKDPYFSSSCQMIQSFLNTEQPPSTNSDDFFEQLTTYRQQKPTYRHGENTFLLKMLSDLLDKDPDNLYFKALKLTILNLYTPITEKMVEERLVDLTIRKNEIENIPAQTAELQAKLASLQNNLTGLSLQSEEDDIRNIQEIQEFTNKEIRALTRFAKAANTHQLSATISKITSITNRSDLPPDSKQRILDFGTIVLGNVKSNYIEDDALRDRTSSQLNILKTLASLLTRNSSFRDDVVLQTIVSSIPPINQENLRDLEELCELQEQIFRQEGSPTTSEDLTNLKNRLWLKLCELPMKAFISKLEQSHSTTIETTSAIQSIKNDLANDTIQPKLKKAITILLRIIDSISNVSDHQDKLVALCELQEQIFRQEPLITEDQPYPEDLANLKRQLQLKIWDLQIKKFEKFIQNTEESIYLHNAEREAILGKIAIIKGAIANDSIDLERKISTVEEHSQQLMAILPDSANISWFRQALRNFLNWVSRNSETVAQNEQHISAIKENYRNTSLSTSQGAATSSENIPKPNPDDDAPDDPQNDSSSLRM